LVDAGAVFHALDEIVQIGLGAAETSNAIGDALSLLS
jgi:hypothetical protein